MIPNPGFASMIQRFWPEGGADGYKKIPPIGPSPMIIHKDILRDVADEYYEMSKKLKTRVAQQRRKTKLQIKNQASQGRAELRSATILLILLISRNISSLFL